MSPQALACDCIAAMQAERALVVRARIVRSHDGFRCVLPQRDHLVLHVGMQN